MSLRRTNTPPVWDLAKYLMAYDDLNLYLLQFNATLTDIGIIDLDFLQSASRDFELVRIDHRFERSYKEFQFHLGTMDDLDGKNSKMVKLDLERYIFNSLTMGQIILMAFMCGYVPKLIYGDNKIPSYLKQPFSIYCEFQKKGVLN
jgi:hypothetical protein